jgi:hypothetical protein
MANITGLSNVVKISSLQIPALTRVFREKKLVVAFMGAPGGGKTSAIKYTASQIAKRMGKNFVIDPTAEDWIKRDEKGEYANFCYRAVLAGQIEETDSTGFPHIVTDSKGHSVTVYTKTELFPTEGLGIIVMDEFPNGRTPVQNALQQILLDHRAGNNKISEDIQFVVAGNRPSDNCGTFYIPAALRNRVAWFEVSRPNMEKWLELMEEIGEPIEPGMQAWLLSIGSKHFDNFDPKAEQYAYGSIRSLTLASNAIAGLGTSEDDYALKRQLVGGFIGAGAGDEFVDFLKLTEQIDINKLLSNPETISKYEDNLGLLYSIAVTMIDRAVESQANTEKVLDVLQHLRKNEHGLFTIKGIINRLGRVAALDRMTKCKNMGIVFAKYKALFNMDNEK